MRIGDNKNFRDQADAETTMKKAGVLWDEAEKLVTVIRYKLNGRTMAMYDPATGTVWLNTPAGDPPKRHEVGRPYRGRK